MNEDLETTVTLRMVYDAVLALVNESQQQRAQWQEAEANLLQQTALHREILSKHASLIDGLKSDAVDQEKEILRLRTWKHDFVNREMNEVNLAIEEIREAQMKVEERISRLEDVLRKDTEMLPPPNEDA